MRGTEDVKIIIPKPKSVGATSVVNIAAKQEEALYTAADHELQEKQAKVEQLKIQNSLERERLDNYKQNRTDRKHYMGKLYRLMCLWLSVVVILIVCSSFSCVKIKDKYGLEFYIPDSVLITIISGTTASIIGLFIVVVKYLFSHAIEGKKE